MAVPAATFLDAAECLLLLAEAENETWSNNATGVFVSLFSLGYDKLAASELAPIEKVPFLRRLLTSKNSCHRALAYSSAWRESAGIHIQNRCRRCDGPKATTRSVDA